MTAAQPTLEISGSRQFTSWLAEQNLSLIFTTYQACRLFFIGTKPDGRLSAFERLFDHAMGLYATPKRLYMSSRYQLWQFVNVLAPGQTRQGYDKLYVPRIGYTTGDIDIHDIALDSKGKVIFVNTLYSCLATLSDYYSFTPLWKPPFISQLAPEDRCHLNGLAMVNGQPGYVTAVSQSDIKEGWRDKRSDGGCVVDVQSNEVIVSGLSMPHSPRWYRDTLWLLNSGTGELGYVDLEQGKFEPVTFCPGYGRGLAFWQDFAIVGLSKPRNKTFSGLALDEQLRAKNTDAQCGVMVIDLNSGEIVHSLNIEGLVTELYDVQVLPGVQRPMALGFKTDEISHILTVNTQTLN